tara:strand:- start:2168 stop:2890 length:723 start_codon:yes stop_codon:yes gene_type:complete
MKLFLKELIWRLGYDVQSVSSSGRDVALALSLMDTIGATAVIDVGANVGQYGAEILARRPKLKVVSFEPTTTAHEALVLRAARHMNWLVGERGAIGEANGNVEINISGNSVSSSILDMLSSHQTAAPGSSYVSKESVVVRRLDNVLDKYVHPTEKLYLKIDTQGYEKQVLDGSDGVLKQIWGIQAELSFVDLYKDQCHGLDLIDLVKGLGFNLYGFSNGFRDEKTKELLQADGFFIRSRI